MLFTSYEFILFVAALLVLYYIIPKRFQWMLLLVASYIFYFCAGPTYLIYISVTTVTIYFAAVMIQNNSDRQKEYLKANKETLSKEEKKNYKDAQKKIRSRWKVGCIILNVGILAVVKYMSFVIGNINSIVELFGADGRLSFWTIAAPLGISYYTFMSVGYLIDVARGTIKAERNLFKLALFVSFFPHLAQGPISRFGDLSKTMYEPHRFDTRVVSHGLWRVMWGFFKKLVVADRISVGVIFLIGNHSSYGGAYSLALLLFYTIQLYADFTGGIDITIGIAECMGISVAENFNRPYFSKSLKEYWRRWHITMCSWFRDYIFYPVSTSKSMQKFSKLSRAKLGEKVGKRLPVYVASFIVWFCTGLWHGASWNFIVWGLLNFVVLMVSEEFEPLYDKFHEKYKFSNGTIYKCFMMARTILLICVLNLFDCYTNIADTIKVLASAFTTTNWHVFWDGSMLQIGLSMADYMVLLLGVIVMLMVSLIQRSGSVREKIGKRPYPVRFALALILFIIVLVIGAYGVGYDSSQFIYNQF